MVHNQLPLGLREELIVGGVIEPTKLLGMLNIPWQGFERKLSQKLKKCKHDRMAGEIISNLEGSSNLNII